MTIAKEISKIKVNLLIGLIFFIYHANATRPITSPSIVFDVTKFGAKGDGKPAYNEDGESIIGMAFIQAWLKACKSIGEATVLIPKGTFAVAQVTFTGPCQTKVTVDLQGDIIADPDVTQFPNNELLVFQQVEGATLSGPGSINANRPASAITPMDTEKPFVYMDLMPSISLLTVTSFSMNGIRSLNPVAFHVLVDSSRNVSISNVKFETANLKPIARSDAIFITMSSAVQVTNSNIKTGDSCVTVSGGSKDVTITGVTCENGHGISIGAQPHVITDYNVNQVKVSNCTFKGSLYGVMINPRPQEAVGQVSNINVEGLTMDQVQNPIAIKQDYVSTTKGQSAKVTGVHFKNIKGTVTKNGAISFACSKTTPCDGIDVADVDLKFNGAALMGKISNQLSATCANAAVTFTGKHDGLSCA